jgi:EAL domain-containing protein (putative c-di-GMP-specific phosphodiesterase class I)
MIARVLREYEEALSLRDLARQAQAPATAAESAAALRPRVFIVDDEEGFCQFVSTAVNSFGYEADYFTSAAAAARALRHCSPAIIFLDIALDGSDAIEVLRKLKELDYRGVVQLMSGSNPGLLDDVRRVGERHKLIMRQPMRKPFRMDAIRQVIAEAPIDQWPDKPLFADETPSIDLDDALARGWLEVWYQPKLSLATRTFVGAESLIRCRHPELGVLPPSTFLPGAPTKSLIALTKFVILTALRDWQELTSCDVSPEFAVNAPIAALTDLDLPGLIREHRPKSPNWPGLLLEVTEGEVSNDIGLAHEIATQLRIYGISLAIDDFGEGYSSFARLRELPFAELKLDGSFVKNCAKDPKSAAICHAVVELAHSFGAVAVAEGLENDADVDAVQKMGCDVGQGFALAKPMPSEVFKSVLRYKMR